MTIWNHTISGGQANAFLQAGLGLHIQAHLLALVEAMLVTVGKVKRSELLTQSLLRGRDGVQGKV